MKQLSVKQAERWLEKLKGQNPQSFKDVCRFLRKYEKGEDEYECFTKVSHTLLAHSDMTKDLNSYLEVGNHFVIDKNDDEKIIEFMGYVKRNRPTIFTVIVNMLKEIDGKYTDHAEKNKKVRESLREISKGDDELKDIVERAVNLSGEELINQLDLTHLKPKKLPPPDQEQEVQVSNTQNRLPYIKKTTKPPKEEEKTKELPPKPKVFTVLTSISQQWAAFKSLEKALSQPTYHSVMKIVRLFFLNIISKQQIFEMLALLNTPALQEQLQHLRDMLETRQAERRKASAFRPLNDQHFSNVGRPSPSYVSIPFSYPIRCLGRTPELKKILNDKWVSVPQGSEENQNFSVRNKNTNEINLLKAEDQRYQFDLYMGRLKKSVQFLTELENPDIPPQHKTKLLKKLIDINILQFVYKNTNKEQKEEIQFHLKVNEAQTCRAIKKRLMKLIEDLMTIREVYANKTWIEIAGKNFFKALDLKGFEFKRNEKERMKGTSFISELQERVKLLQAGGESRSFVPFLQKKNFFTILNSFQSSTRSQHCTSRVLPKLIQFDMKDEQRRQFYPVLILAFEDASICRQTYNIILFYIDSLQLPEGEKMRCRLFLQLLLVKYMGWELPLKRTPNDKFNEEKLFSFISNYQQVDDKILYWVNEQEEQSSLGAVQTEEEAKGQSYNLDEPSMYSYLPLKHQRNTVLYGSQHLYTLIRFLYALYERLIKLREISEDKKKVVLFDLLFIACIKAKESQKFQQNLNILFNKHAYLFSTLYKLLDSLIKSLSNVTSCQITQHGFYYMNELSEDVYLMKMNRFCLISSLTNQKMIRLTNEGTVLYINYLQSYYKTDDPTKEGVKKRMEINKRIEEYITKVDLLDRKKKKNQIIQVHGMEYIFEANSVKMSNHMMKEDIMLSLAKKVQINKIIKRELKRTHKIVNTVV